MHQAKENPPQIREMIDSFLSLLVKRSSQGIRNSDPNLEPNFGFLGTKGVEIDCGNYRSVVFDKTSQILEIQRFASQFRAYLKKVSPESLLYFDEALDVIISGIDL